MCDWNQPVLYNSTCTCIIYLYVKFRNTSNCIADIRNYKLIRRRIEIRQVWRRLMRSRRKVSIINTLSTLYECISLNHLCVMRLCLLASTSVSFFSWLHSHLMNDTTFIYTCTCIYIMPVSLWASTIIFRHEIIRNKGKLKNRNPTINWISGPYPI